MNDRRLLINTLVFFAALTFTACAPTGAKPTAASVAGSLNVLVRPADRTIEPVPVTDPGALPVHSGGAMVIDVELDQPAFIFLIWINPEGQIIPLYPWNNETLDVKDISQPPPVRRATKRIFSPLLGRSWTFGDRNGAETVILLARRTALPENIQLAKLLTSPPTPEFENSTDHITLRIPKSDANKDASATPGSESNQSALASYLQPLAQHFDLIEALQFAHADKKPE